jgi:hypothetical protein
LEVSGSWDDPERYREYADEFAALWADRHPDVHTVTLPEALRLKLVKLAPAESPVAEPSQALARQKAAMLWRFIVEAPYLSNGGPVCDATAMVESWPHQRRVVEDAAAAWPEGRLLCDEVGMGKTIEAVLVLRRLMSGRGVRRVLFLLPAGLLTQWQAELREKGGVVFPRLEGTTALVSPDERTERVSGLAEALERDAILISREMARLPHNAPIVLAAAPWDLVVLDEAHAARRREQEEGEFNSGTLLLDLLRQLQLHRRARGILLLSATPMQTQPWEPWDLLGVLGVGGYWLADFAGVRDFYAAVAALENGACDVATARRAAALVATDIEFPASPASGPAGDLDRVAPPGLRGAEPPRRDGPLVAAGIAARAAHASQHPGDAASIPRVRSAQRPAAAADRGRHPLRFPRCGRAPGVRGRRSLHREALPRAEHGSVASAGGKRTRWCCSSAKFDSFLGLILDRCRYGLGEISPCKAKLKERGA